MSAALAIGVFDGLHLGHQAILERALARARAAAGRCVVVSFDPHPDVVLARETFRVPPPLTPLQVKRARLRALGVDRLEIIPFTRELAALTPEAFVDRHLVAPHAPHALVVGEDFALGRGRAGNVPRLRAIGATRGFEVEAVPLRAVDGAPVTSTRIRGLLAAGQVAQAARLLGRPYVLAGRVVTGDGRGRALGFPTANLRLHEEQLLPADGIYAARARLAGEPDSLAGAMSIGVRPTFGGQERTIEIHLLDWSGELPGRDLEVEMVDWLRRELRYESATALAAAIADDVAETRRRLARVASSREP
jgi:riboflavin kinase/FMN adenylyltransferase